MPRIIFLFFSKQQAFRQNLNNQNNKGRPKTIKFESDFDFEQANTKFEEVRLSLAKLKVGEEIKPEQVFFFCYFFLFLFPKNEIIRCRFVLSM